MNKVKLFWIALCVILLPIKNTAARYELVKSGCRITNFPFNVNASYDSALRLALVDYLFVLSDQQGLHDIVDLVQQNQAGLMRPALVYPNPFRLSEGAQLGYQLTKPMDVELIVYDLFANEIYKEFIPDNNRGSHGGDLTYNKIPLTRSKFSYDLPAGVYFFVIMGEGKVLGKGKFAIRP